MLAKDLGSARHIGFLVRLRVSLCSRQVTLTRTGVAYDRRAAGADHRVLLAVRGDLVRVLMKLLKERKVFDGIIIETTGEDTLRLFTHWIRHRCKWWPP